MTQKLEIVSSSGPKKLFLYNTHIDFTDMIPNVGDLINTTGMLYYDKEHQICQELEGVTLKVVERLFFIEDTYFVTRLICEETKFSGKHIIP